MSNPNLGKIGWHDLTVPDAQCEQVRDFYAAVAGWTPRDHPVGDYADYDMLAPDGECVTGVCHKKGGNAAVPTAWLVYVNVADADAAAAKAKELGGTVLDGPRGIGGGRFAVVKDPAGAVFALWTDPPPK